MGFESEAAKREPEEADIKEVLRERRDKIRERLKADDADRNQSQLPPLRLGQNSNDTEHGPEKYGQTRKEAYAFSKEFSRTYRNRLAGELHDIRQKYRAESLAEKETRAELRDAIDRRLASDADALPKLQEEQLEAARISEEALTELHLRHKEIEALETQIERKKHSLVNRLTLTLKTNLGFVIKETKQEQALAEKREQGEAVDRAFSASYRRKAMAERRVSEVETDATSLPKEKDQLRDLVLDEVVIDTIKKRLNDFYVNQLGIKDDWEKTQQERNVDVQTRAQNVVFLHAIPSLAEGAADSGAAIDTRQLSAEAKSELVVGLEPAISASSKFLSAEQASYMRGRETIYNSGLIITGGTILRAADIDMFTYAEDLDVKYPKLDSDATSSVQTSPSELIEQAVVKTDNRRGHIHSWNEFVIQRPKVAGVFFGEDPWGGENDLVQACEMARDLGLPLIHMPKNGTMKDMITGREVMLDQLLDRAAEYSPEERVDFIEKNIDDGGKTSNSQIDERIAKIKAEGGSVSEETLAWRSGNAQKASDALQALSLGESARFFLTDPKCVAALVGGGDSLLAHLESSDPQTATRFSAMLAGVPGAELIRRFDGLARTRERLVQTMNERSSPYEASKQILSFTREELDAILNDPAHTPEQLLDLFERNFKGAFRSSVGVSEGYTLRQHTAMVINQFQKYLKDAPVDDRKFFECVLAIHDIGKPLAVADSFKLKEHEYTVEMMRPLLGQLGYAPGEIAVAEALIDGDPIGLLLRGRTVDDMAQEAFSMCERSGLPFDRFWDLLVTFYKADASSYTEHVSGHASPLDRVFTFDADTGAMHFASQAEQKILALKERAEALTQKTS